MGATPFPAVALALILAGLLSAGCARPATSSPMKDYEFTFHQIHPSGPPSDVVHIYVAVDRSGRIHDFHSVMLLSSGAVVAENSWNIGTPGSELTYNWATCHRYRDAVPETIPRTVAALESSVLGPANPPADATVISKNTWQIGQGIAILEVHQTGPGITDRIVKVELPGAREPGTITMHAALKPIAAMPDLSRRWRACRAGQRP